MEDNIKTNLIKSVLITVVLVYLPQGNFLCWGFVNTVMRLLFSYNVTNFLTTRDLRFAPQRKRDLRSSGILRTVAW